MKVLITGGAGFIGSNLCERMVSHPEIDEIRVIDNLSSGFVDNLAGLGVGLWIDDILDEAALAEAADGVDAIVHLAAVGSVPRSVEFPLASHEANATGTLRVLEAARANGNAHVVLASSSSVYGANPQLPKSEDMLCMPMSPYAVSKLATEQYAMVYARCYDLPVLPFRFFNVYGPRQAPDHAYAAVVPAFLAAAVRGEALTVHGDGTQSRDFTYVGAVTEALTRVVTGGLTAGPTNLAFGSRTTLLDLIGLIENSLGSAVAVEHGPNRAGDVPHSQADSTRLDALLPGLAPTPLEVGVTETLAWMKSHV